MDHRIDNQRGVLLAELCKWRDAGNGTRSIEIGLTGQLTIVGPDVGRLTLAKADVFFLRQALRHIERSTPIEIPKDALHLVAELKESLGQGRVA